jgi:hypothetical protein
MLTSRQAQLVADWRRFIRGGFRLEDLTEPLYRHLVVHGNPEAADVQNRDEFWETYFISLWTLNTFLSDCYEATPQDALNQAFKAALDEVYWDLNQRLEEIEMDLYREIRESELETWVDAEAAKRPECRREEIEAELRDYYDLCMQQSFYADWYCELDLDEAMRHALTIETKANAVPHVHHPSVFELAGWLAADTKEPPPSGLVSRPILFAEVTVEAKAKAEAENRPEASSTQTRTLQPVSFFSAVDGLPPADAQTDEVDPPDADVTPQETNHPNLEAIKRRLAATPEQEAELAERRRIRQQAAAQSAQIARQR